MEKNLEYYLKLPWSYRIEWSDIDNCFLGSIEELEENMTCAESPEEVLINLKDALKSYILTSIKAGLEIPEPVKLSNYKGNITYRTTPEKHYKLAKKAAAKGKSINKLLDELVEKEVA
jgi:predicted RNase H-like HicB family nuclease